jgi:hypothetical protein
MSILSDGESSCIDLYTYSQFCLSTHHLSFDLSSIFNAAGGPLNTRKNPAYATPTRFFADEDSGLLRPARNNASPASATASTPELLRGEARGDTRGEGFGDGLGELGAAFFVTSETAIIRNQQT